MKVSTHELYNILIALKHLIFYHLEDALSKVMFVLKQLGEELPSNVTEEIVMNELTETRSKLATYTKSDILALPLMTDEQKLVSPSYRTCFNTCKMV